LSISFSGPPEKNLLNGFIMHLNNIKQTNNAPQAGATKKQKN